MKTPMTGRERMLRTLAFDQPDQIPVDCWALPEIYIKYGPALKTVVDKYSADIHRVAWKNAEYPFDRYAAGKYTDAWGCEWLNFRNGIIGEVKVSPLADWAQLDTYRAPFHVLEQNRDNIESDIAAHHDKFILMGAEICLFERMQHLRGTENLLMDIAGRSDEFYRLLDIVSDFYDKWLDMWLQYDIDAVLFTDDWGSQTSLLISPDAWRQIFKPCYKKLMNKALERGRRVFFHSDGRIDLIFADLIELGCTAINSQVWIMNKEELSQKYRGKVTFWGELNRQGVLAAGKADNILRDIKTMKRLFMHQGGGLIGTAAPSDDCSYEGIVTCVTGWNSD